MAFALTLAAKKTNSGWPTEQPSGWRWSRVVKATIQGFRPAVERRIRTFYDDHPCAKR
jgi:hypothetical protein